MDQRTTLSVDLAPATSPPTPYAAAGDVLVVLLAGFILGALAWNKLGRRLPSPVAKLAGESLRRPGQPPPRPSCHGRESPAAARRQRSA
jgi:hypothetical protein